MSYTTEKTKYLNSHCNEKETYRQFIRSSERDLGVDKVNLRSLTFCQVQEYVDFLDEMWNK